MSTLTANQPFIGIDFGTSNSSMAWYNPRSGQAEVIKNAEGEPETPSIVYFGEDDVLVGEAGVQVLDGEVQSDDQQRIITSIKRRLINPPLIAMPGGRNVRPVEVVAEILAKLKRDAESGLFYTPVTRAVITCPALFDSLQRDVLVRAAELAGFIELELVDEPVAAALTFGREGQNVGDEVLVYDLGGGTFDLAFVKREEDGSYYVAMETDGKADCGGDDFDQLLYDFWDQQAERDLDRSISKDPGTVDVQFLRACRQRKENLTLGKQCVFRTLLADGQAFRPSIDRSAFEELIRPIIEGTVQQTLRMLRRAEELGFQVDTVLLVGGSSSIPLVRRLLEEALPVAPKRTQHQDVAVALGAAYYGERLWGTTSASRSVRAAAPVSSGQASADEPMEPEAGSLGLAQRTKQIELAHHDESLPDEKNESLLPSTLPATNAYLSLVISRLQAKGFQCTPNVSFNKVDYAYIAGHDFYGQKLGSSVATWFLFSHFSDAQRNSLLGFANSSASYLSGTKKYTRTNVALCVPVALVDGVEAGTAIKFVGSGPFMYRMRYPIYPVLCDVRSRQILLSDKSPWNGKLFWPYFRKLIKELLAFA